MENDEVDLRIEYGDKTLKDKTLDYLQTVQTRNVKLGADDVDGLMFPGGGVIKKVFACLKNFIESIRIVEYNKKMHC